MDTLYNGITLDWYYGQQYVDISVINYVLKKLANYKQPPLKRAQYCNLINSIMVKDQTLCFTRFNIRQVVSSFLDCAQAVDMTILLALTNIATQQATSTGKTMPEVR